MIASDGGASAGDLTSRQQWGGGSISGRLIIASSLSPSWQVASCCLRSRRAATATQTKAETILSRFQRAMSSAPPPAYQPAPAKAPPAYTDQAPLLSGQNPRPAPDYNVQSTTPPPSPPSRWKDVPFAIVFVLFFVGTYNPHTRVLDIRTRVQATQHTTHTHQHTNTPTHQHTHQHPKTSCAKQRVRE